MGRPRARRAEDGQAAVQGPGLPGADPARRRPGAPVPLHLGALAQPRGPRPQPQDPHRALRPGQGPADLRALRAARQPAVRPARGHHRRAPQAALPGHGGARRRTPSGSPATRTWRSRRTTPRTSSRPWRRSCSAVASGRRCAWRSRSPSTSGSSTCSSPSSASTPQEVFRLPGPLDLTGLHGIADLGREDLKYPAFVPTTHTPARRGRVVLPGRRVRRRTPPRRAAAPPLRLVRHVGAALHRAGRGRPARARDQADALPHLRRQPHHRRPGRRRRGRQAGAGDRRDQGALRRAGQHPLGAQAGAGRLPRGLRARRPQDPQQAGDGRARRAGRHPPLHPHRHRQLQPQDRAALRGPRPADGRRGDRRGRRPPVQQPVGAVAQHDVRLAARRARSRCATG